MKFRTSAKLDELVLKYFDMEPFMKKYADFIFYLSENFEPDRFVEVGFELGSKAQKLKKSIYKVDFISGYAYFVKDLSEIKQLIKYLETKIKNDK